MTAAASETARKGAFDTLADVQAAGFVIDEWSRWQQGDCGDYALSLINQYPHLRLGVLANEDNMESHFFAHDGTRAYDSAGIHPMPYLGVSGTAFQAWLDDSPEDYGLAYEATEDSLMAARAHQVRHGIIPE